MESLFLLHLVSTLPLILNPPFQFFEEIFNFPAGLKHSFLLELEFAELCFFLEFGWRRVLLRSGIVGCLLLIALSVPNFDVILQLIGSTTITLLNLVFPSIFYLLLNRKYQLATGSTEGDEETRSLLSTDLDIE